MQSNKDFGEYRTRMWGKSHDELLILCFNQHMNLRSINKEILEGKYAKKYEEARTSLAAMSKTITDQTKTLSVLEKELNEKIKARDEEIHKAHMVQISHRSEKEKCEKMLDHTRKLACDLQDIILRNQNKLI